MLALASVFGSIPNYPGSKLLLHHQALGFVGVFHRGLLNIIKFAIIRQVLTLGEIK